MPDDLKAVVERLQDWLDYYHDVDGRETCDRDDPQSPTIDDLRTLLRLAKSATEPKA